MRGEFIGAALCVLCIALPSIEQRLKAADGGQGRRAASEAVPGSVSGFVLNRSRPEAVVKELAWASFVTLRNTNTCSLIIGADDELLAARGALGERCRGSAGAKLEFDAVAVALREDLQRNPDAMADAGTSGRYFESRGEVERSAFANWSAVPSGAHSAFVLRRSGGVWLIALSELDQGLTDADTQWLRSVAEKVSGVLAAAKGIAPGASLTA